MCRALMSDARLGDQQRRADQRKSLDEVLT